MAQGASEYPISHCISQIMDEYGFSQLELVLAVGEGDLDNGLRNLDLWLEQGHGPESMIEQITAAFPAHAEALATAVTATITMKRAEADAAWLEKCRAEEETFTPYIHVEGERSIPDGIGLFGVTGGNWNLIRIPQDILDLSLEEQLAALPDLMDVYRRAYDGFCPFFGKLMGFKYVRCLDHYQFDADGNLMEHVAEPFRRGECFVRLR